MVGTRQHNDVKSIHCRHVCPGQLTRSVIDVLRITPKFISSRLQLQPPPLDTRSRPTRLSLCGQTTPKIPTGSASSKRRRAARTVREADFDLADGWDSMKAAVTASQGSVGAYWVIIRDLGPFVKCVTKLELTWFLPRSFW
jgi:hypothetical protein